MIQTLKLSVSKTLLTLINETSESQMCCKTMLCILGTCSVPGGKNRLKIILMMILL